MPRKVKSFDKTGRDRELGELDNRLSAYNSLLHHLSQIKEGATTLDEVEAFLNAKTGFVNPRVSADAMGVLEPYSKAIDLSNLIEGLNHTALVERKTSKPYKVYAIDPKYKALVEEKYTTYYTAEQSKQIEALEKAIDAINKLDTPFKEALNYNRRDKTWIWAKQHTNNTISEIDRFKRYSVR
jgi:hypothetical protein